MERIRDLRACGLSLSEIARQTGYDRKTIRKYLRNAQPPRYGPRRPRPLRQGPPRYAKLGAYHSYLDRRMQEGVWSATVLFREIQAQGYDGCYTRVKDYVRPRRKNSTEVAVRRFETPPGKQAQVDWAQIGTFEENGERHRLYAFVFTLGCSRAMFADASASQSLSVFLRMHEAAFSELGGVPSEILYDWMKTVASGVDGRGEVRWNPKFLDFARYWGFTPKLCHPYRPQTKGKIENGIGYVRKSFIVGREVTDVADTSRQLRIWTWDVANQRLHGTTYRVVREAWAEEKPYLQPIAGRPAYAYVEEETRKVSRDAFVAYKANRLSVPWVLAGSWVTVRERQERIEVVKDGATVAIHPLPQARHQVLIQKEHHAGMPYALEALNSTKPMLRIQRQTPEVEIRSLAVYDDLTAQTSVYDDLLLVGGA